MSLTCALQAGEQVEVIGSRTRRLHFDRAEHVAHGEFFVALRLACFIDSATADPTLSRCRSLLATVQQIQRISKSSILLHNHSPGCDSIIAVSMVKAP